MGKIKMAQLAVQCDEQPLKVKRVAYKDFFEVAPTKVIKKMVLNARGNDKVAMILALGDMED